MARAAPQTAGRLSRSGDSTPWITRGKGGVCCATVEFSRPLIAQQEALADPPEAPAEAGPVQVSHRPRSFSVSGNPTRPVTSAHFSLAMVVDLDGLAGRPHATDAQVRRRLVHRT